MCLDVEKVDHIMETLQKTKHNGYPIFDGYDPSIENSEKFGLLKGLILKNQLLILIHTDFNLEHRDFNERVLSSLYWYQHRNIGTVTGIFIE